MMPFSRTRRHLPHCSACPVTRSPNSLTSHSVLIKAKGRSGDDFGPALGTELPPGLDVGMAAGAFVLGPQRLAAFGAELGALGMGAAMRTGSRSLDFRRYVDPAGLVGLAGLGPDLLDRGLR